MFLCFNSSVKIGLHKPVTIEAIVEPFIRGFKAVIVAGFRRLEADCGGWLKAGVYAYRSYRLTNEEWSRKGVCCGAPLFCCFRRA
jgi:hypothetical protein